MVLMLLFFFISGAAIEHYKPLVGHETCATLILGMCVSLIVYAIVEDEFQEVWKFNPQFFFYFLLPPIIFNSGFNMRKKRFFANLGNIMLFGLAVTLVCFTLYTTISIVVLDKLPMKAFNYMRQNQPDTYTTEESEFDIKSAVSGMQIALLCALLCSSDVVAAVSIVSYKEQPKLYSCVFGEGVFNDIVSIILYGTVSGFLTASFKWYTPFEIFGEFILLWIISIAIGVFVGFGTSFLFKHAKFLTVNAVTETFLMFALGLTGYFIAEMIVIAGNPMSGVMALLTCSIIDSHYTWYNLSPQGKSTSTVTIAFMGTFCEASVYSYVGIALYSSIPTWWSFTFIGVFFAIVVVFRIISIFSVFYLGRCCCRRKTISFRELIFISYAGMIRGAIAFALVLEIPYCAYDDFDSHPICTCVNDGSCL